MDHLLSSVISRTVVTVPTPSAGADWTYTVPAGAIYQGAEGILLKSVAAKLQTSSASGQQPFLVITDAAGNVVAESAGCNATQGATTTCAYSWSGGLVQSGLQGSSADVHSQSPLPMGKECMLSPGWIVKTHTISLAGTSQWSAIVLHVVLVG